jgi:serine/threonine protein kinase
MPQKGEIVENYRLVELLGSGAFGSVYRAENPLLPEIQVAVKFFHIEDPQSSLERSTFLDEARLLTRLRYPSILSIINVGIYQKIFPYIITEYAPKGTLKTYLQNCASQPVTLEEALRILEPIGKALHYAHTQERPIVHRDLKPANILFNANGDALLADFGIAIVLSSNKTHDSNAHGGSAPYMAPEQFNGMTSPKCDQYALGCIAYELLTGGRLFSLSRNSGIEAWWYHHAKKKPVAPRQLNPAIPQQASDAILKALAKRREDRYETVEAFIQALRSSAQPSPAETRQLESTIKSLPQKQRDIADITTKRQSPSPIPDGNNRRNRPWLIPLVVFLLILLSVGGVGVWFVFSSPTANILLTPASKLEQGNFTFTGVSGPSDSSKQQVSVHMLSSSESGHMAAQATGTVAATKAKGTLRFTNTGGYAITLASTTLRGTSGVPVTFDGSIMIPGSGYIFVQGHAVNAGSSGNIPVDDINTLLVPDSNVVYVTNTEGFSGGQDAMPEVLSQDIDKVAKPLIDSLSPKVDRALQKQVKSNESPVSGSHQCRPQQTSDHQAGEHVRSFTVTVSVECSETVYDYAATSQMTTALLKQMAKNDPALGTKWQLDGQVVLIVGNITTTGEQILLPVAAKGLWVYQFTDQDLARLKQQLVHRSKADAQTILQQEHGVISVSITLSKGETMPSSVDDITITSKQLPGAIS